VATDTLVSADSVQIAYLDEHGKPFVAVQDVSFEVRKGEKFVLLGPSGCGKSTLLKAVGGFIRPVRGRIRVSGRDVREPGPDRALVFQEFDQLFPWLTVERNVVNALKVTRRSRGREREVARRFIDLMGIGYAAGRYPHTLSGGMKQRVAIARSFAGSPRVVICDEPVSDLDVSVQAAILNLLADLQRDAGSSYIFISHDLNVVRYLSDRIAVLYLGRLMEVGPAESVFNPPHHPYTEALLSAVPTFEGEESTRIRLEGEIPSAASPPAGCVFHTRCPRRIEGVCNVEEPPLREVERGHFLRCHISIDQLRRLQVRGGEETGDEPPRLTLAAD
jgi:peptide/nickel transport system ATP-binding protein